MTGWWTLLEAVLGGLGGSIGGLVAKGYLDRRRDDRADQREDRGWIRDQAPPVYSDLHEYLTKAIDAQRDFHAMYSRLALFVSTNVRSDFEAVELDLRLLGWALSEIGDIRERRAHGAAEDAAIWAAARDGRDKRAASIVVTSQRIIAQTRKEIGRDPA